MRCESGVGGRLLEVYDEATGEGLELGRITVWDPGQLLAWHSSVDDVETTVRFVAVESGTRVVVEAHVPEGGKDQGGSSWVRVAPSWFETWLARRDSPSAARSSLSRLALTVAYARPAAAARWLTSVIGLEASLPIPPEDTGEELWIEFRIGDGLLVIVNGSRDHGVPSARTHVPMIFVDDLDMHYAGAVSTGATVVQDIQKYGYRSYILEDPEGHHWTIAQALPSMRGAN
jgi:uncharacterized glyoxalase superfamily protein PhnB